MYLFFSAFLKGLGYFNPDIPSTHGSTAVLGVDGWLFSLDWSSSVGSRHKEPGQSRTTLNLTAAAPTLIGRLATHGAGAEIPTGKASELSGQTDGASGHLELSSAGDARSGAHQANGGALSPIQVAHGKVARGEFADNHRTARSEGNIRSKAYHELNI